MRGKSLRLGQTAAGKILREEPECIESTVGIWNFMS